MNTKLEADIFLKKAKKEGFLILYHSGDSSINESLATGIDGRFGKWREEILSGAIDDEDFYNEIKNNDTTSFYAKEPKWVAMKAARACNKSRGEVTSEDIENFGQLCIIGVDPDDTDFKVLKISDTSFGSEYLNGEECHEEVPFGVEENDIFSTAISNPVDITLSGKELVKFLKLNFPELNKVKYPEERNAKIKESKNYNNELSMEP